MSKVFLALFAAFFALALAIVAVQALLGVSVVNALTF